MHPQWLLEKRKPPSWMARVTGVFLDIGAGDRWLQPLLPPGAFYIALDYPSTGTALYRSSPHVLADAAQLPLLPDSVECIACLEVIEHVREPDALLAEVARVLRRGGVACLSMPFLYPVHDAPHDYQRWTEHGWRRSVASAGMELVSIRASGSAIESAGLMVCLAISGPLQRLPLFARVVAVPVALVLIPLVNVSAWSLARLWPGWIAMTAGFHIELRKP